MERKRDRKSFTCIPWYQRSTPGDNRSGWYPEQKRQHPRKRRSKRRKRKMAWYVKRPECMLTERSGRNVRRIHRSSFCIHAAWWKISEDRDAGNGCQASGINRRLRYRKYDELRIWSISVNMEPISRSNLCSDRVYRKDRCSRWRLQQDPFHIPGIFPSYDRRSTQMESAVCSSSRSLQCTAWIRTSIHRWKGQYVRNIRRHRCTTDTGIFRSGHCKRKRHYHTGT